ncbi:MAG: ATP-binding cassette domain-containing protein [Ruminococcaceae bacterium]|nr:ATP-binding cassette domain-containing protein [Oscillospiraceae bacterium]
MNKEIKISVNDLKISFRTDGGKVQAVRNISFDLYKGETLAIVGESGSGKSVTSKAIMGISAGNAIFEGGEILYDGQDLMRIPEEEMHKLRGDKIAMIFQDPLSALNPIMRIGRQITEAMLLKNKANRKEGRVTFNKTLAEMSDIMKKAVAESGNTSISAAEIDKYIKTFDNFNIQAIKLENSYNESRTAAEEMIAAIEDLLFLTEKNQKVDVASAISVIRRKLKDINDKYFTSKYADSLKGHAAALDSAIRASKKNTGKGAAKNKASAEVVEALEALKQTAKDMVEQPQYNFFRIGYYVYKNPETDLSKMPAEEANELAIKFLNENFMDSFLALVKIAVQYSFNKTIENKKAAIAELENAISFFKAGSFSAKDADATWKRANQSVLAAIDPLAVVKDNVAYTFGGAIEREVDKYFFYIKNNPKEEARFARQTAQREALLAKGKTVDWKIVPKSVIEPEVQIETIVSVLTRVMNKFKADVENALNFDVDKHCIDIIDYLKAKASQVVYTLTKRIAKEKAIKLMEEVGIPEARMRYRQYPFEFSGGMRQRIVIAIALSANPDVLICDEPTTALDVTIQAQILELINRLKREHNLSIIFITHDLGVVANMADRIAVMYAGKIVEYGTAEEVFYNPQHPYTWALLSSMPDLDTNEKLDAIPGTPPNMIYPPVGDAFAERNKYAMEIDFEMQPPMYEVSPTHFAATWLLHPNAPKVEIPKIITERIQRMKERGGNHGE